MRLGRDMSRRGKVHDQEKLAILRREIGIGLEAAAEGRFSKKTVRDIADEVRRENASG
jgi:antitoxin ParD1/3/4